uniref:Uncharacterized protein n=1 Tax=Rhizophora mucronata TaxID=61149 RepID=A0A2P2L5W1_RHIMU
MEELRSLLLFYCV